MDFPKRAGKKGEDQKKREAEKSFLEFAIKFAPLFTIVLLIFLVYLGAPLLQGMELSVNFLTGKTQNPSICINTTSKLDLPEERQLTAASGSDIYTTCAEPVKLNSGYTVPSLQYLGQGGESIFLYHFPSGGIVVIPKERLLTYTLYNKPDRPENIFLK